MTAYIIAVITKNIEGEHDRKMRILDLSPSANIRVFDYPFKEVVEAVYNNKIQLVDCTYLTGSIRYCGKHLEEVIPELETPEHKNRKLIALGAVKEADNTYSMILSSTDGKIKKLFFSEIFTDKALLKRVVNIKFKRAKLEVDAPYIIKDDEKYYVTKINGDIINTLNSQTKSINNDALVFTDWIDVDTFEKEMIENGYSYQINSGTSFMNLDTKVPVINIPKGIKYIESVFGDSLEHDNINLIRIPSTVISISTEAFENIKNINKIVYEDNEKYPELRCSGFISISNNITELNKLLPKRIINMTYFARDYDAKADLSSLKELEKIQFSYTRCNINSNILFPDSLNNITSSFMGMLNKIESLCITKNIAYIFTSFVNSSIKNITFEENTALIKIYDSFRDIEDLEVLDLTGCKSLLDISASFKSLPKLKKVILPESIEKIDSSFCDCPNLTEIKLPDSLICITGRSFSNTGITQVDINERISDLRAFDKGTTIDIYPKLKINRYILRTIDKDFKINIHDGATEIQSNTTDGVCVDNISFPNTIRVLDSSSFSNSKGEKIDMFNWGVTVIPDYCFRTTGIKTIILPKTTNEIKDNIFEESTSISKVFIPEAVTSIAKKAFYKVNGSSNFVEFYVVENSYAHRFLEKDKLRVNVCKSDEEAYNKISGISFLSSESSQTKAKMIYGSSDEVLGEITSTDYIQNVNQLVSIYNKMKEGCDTDKISIRLPNEMYKKHIKIESVFDVVKDLPLTYFNDKCESMFFDTLIDFLQGKSIPNSPRDLTNQFKILYKIIYENTKPLSRALSVDGFIKMLSLTNNNNLKLKYKISTTYSDDYSSIFCLNIGSFDFGDKIQLWGIVIGDSIVYLTPCLCSQEVKMKFNSRMFPFGIEGNKQAEFHKEIAFNVSEFINVGDIIGIRDKNTTTLKGVKLSPKLDTLVYNEIENQISLLGEKTLDKNQSMVLLSLIDGTIFICEYRCANDLNHTSKLNKFVVNKKLKYDDWGTLYKKSINNNIMSSNDESISLLNQIAFEKESLIELMCQDGAYDVLSPCIEWEIGKVLQENGIDSIDKLNYKAVELMLNTAFTSVSKKSYDVVDYWEIVESYELADGTTVKTCKLKNSKRSYGCMVGYEQFFFITFRKPNQPIYEEVEGFVSNVMFKEIFNGIRWLYDSRATECNYIDDNIHLQKDFSILFASNIFSGSVVTSLGINKKDGGVYLLGVDYHSSDTVVLLRYKNLETAVKECKPVYLLSNTSSSKSTDSTYHECLTFEAGRIIERSKIKVDAAYELREKLKLGRSSSVSKAYEIREKLMNGYPNGYKVQGICGAAFESSAKRRPKL